MTNEQILLLSRIRVGLQRAGVTVDLVRMTRDRVYLEEVLFRASELTDETAVQSSLMLMSQLGMINGRRVLDPPIGSAQIRGQHAPGADPAQPLRSGGSGETSAASSSQPDPLPQEPGRFSTPMGATTGSSPNPVPGGKSYKRGLR